MTSREKESTFRLRNIFHDNFHKGKQFEIQSTRYNTSLMSHPCALSLICFDEQGSHLKKKSIEFFFSKKSLLHRTVTYASFTNVQTSSSPCVNFTLVRVMLNWMVRITTRMSKLPREISVSDLSVYHVTFFNICEMERDRS